MSDTQPNVTAAQALIGRERIRGAARVIAEGTEPAAVTAEQVCQVAADVVLFTRAHGIYGNELAQAVRYSPGTISDFLKGKYKGDNGQVAIDLENWLVTEEHRRTRPRTTEFVWSNVAMTIRATASYCLDYRKIGLVYGPETSGVGKTTALMAIHQQLGPRASALVTIDKVDASSSGLIRKLCTALRLAHEGNNRQRFERIRDELKGRSHILLIDQAHNLRGAKDDKPLYILADLYDATNTAQLWCCTSDMVEYLNRQRDKSGDESLAQIRRRICPCVDLMEAVKGGGGGGGGEPLVTVDQCRAMFAKNKLRLTPSAVRFLCDLCNQADSGAVGLCVQLVEYGGLMAEMRRLTSIDLPLLKEAMARCFTPQRAGLLLKKLDLEPAAAPPARAISA